MTTAAIIFRIGKYILNVAGLYIMTITAKVISTLVWRFPDCDVVRIKISENIGELILIYIPYLAIATGLNWLLERKLEKRPTSKEYRFLFYASVLILLIAIIYSSYHVYSNCRK